MYVNVRTFDLVLQDNEDHSTKSTIKTRSNKLKHLSRSESYLPYTWKRSDSLADGLKSATDLSYKNTYGELDEYGDDMIYYTYNSPCNC